MACREVVCQDCATTWDGINFCRPCLAVKQQAADASSGAWIERFAVVIQLAACLAGLAATARIAAWSLALIRSWSV